MKKTLLLSFTSLLLCTSCANSISKLSTRLNHLGGILKSKVNYLLSDETQDSKLVVTAAEFYGAYNEEFVPLNSEEINGKITSLAIPQPSITPGTLGSTIPSINSFKEPASILKSIFVKIFFNTDSYTPKDAEAKKSLEKMANYLKKHPKTYVFIEGHCDERASESYNLALGTKRSNNIRTILVNYGVNPNQLYTISYGKERPIALGHNKASYEKNRRVAFKIYEDKK
jgi:peptidoglycan-associated lipoprotein